MRSQITSPVSSSALLKNRRLLHAPIKDAQPSAKAYLVEETLVVDERASRRPAQAVEDKLSQMLKTNCIGVSQLRLKDLLSGRAKKA